MANSTQVDHTIPVLASQYNNLRKDVLDITTGHDHSGNTNEGKQLAGSTALSAQSVLQGQLAYGSLFLVKRQGGHATDWSVAGLDNYAISTNTAIQSGILSVVVVDSYVSGTATIAFGTAFANAPLVYATAYDNTSHPGTVGVAAVSVKPTTGSTSTHLDIYASRPPLADTATAGTIYINWFAIGPIS